MTEPFILRNERYFTLADFEEICPGIKAGFTTKNGGVSTGEYQTLNTGFHVGDFPGHAAENRKLVADSLGFGLGQWVGAEQTHETKVLKVTAEDKGKGSADYESAIRATDAFYTEEAGILLTLCYADCVPLYFTARGRSIVGVAHAGWKGTVGGIGEKMVLAWEKEGIQPSDIIAAIGPSICEDCYIVDDRVIEFAKNRLEETDKKPYNQISEGQYRLDLKELNAMILEKAGVPRSNILLTDYCTSCHGDFFFSHRKDQGKTGRMLAFIGLKEDASVEG
ncbi:peptidoglycan editing factor PgeF [Peribacillus kribbensis]|uniref:peptidoglycan editing factor PgeF n=1 Tax=Peribacillus kribbensis TaxID=356658 RepID=UPI00041A0E47|nr:peptidoglycan editing factor PgeF [Peribacillus kribbensis]